VPSGTSIGSGPTQATDCAGKSENAMRAAGASFISMTLGSSERQQAVARAAAPSNPAQQPRPGGNCTTTSARNMSPPKRSTNDQRRALALLASDERGVTEAFDACPWV